MKLALLTCAIYPTGPQAEAALWIFMKSAAKAGFEREDVHLYGIGRDFHRTDWRTKKLIYQLDYLKGIPAEYTHILYSDGADALLVGTVSEIIAKYFLMGLPPLMCSAYHAIANPNQVFNESGLYDNCFDNALYYRYPHCGGYLAERAAIIDAFERMLRLPRQSYDDCWNWMDAWKEGWFRPLLDSERQIFYVADEVAIEDQRAVTDGSLPCVIHLTGGHVDRETGKDYKLEPLARRLGIL